MAASSFLHCSTTSTFSSTSKTKLHKSSPSCKPIKLIMSMSQNHTSWATINSEVEAHIEHALSGKQRVPMVFDPMNHLILEVPRSMAPALCIAACEAVGGKKEQAIPAASALHLMHVATYTHEYLQVSDKSMLATMPHHGYEPSIELLTADGMIPFGYELLAAMEDPANNNSESVLQVMIEIGRAMGSQGVINGQYLNVRCLGLDGEKPCDEEGMMDQVFEKKGGALYSCGAACGAILGGGSDEEIEKLRRYGLYVGMIHGIMVHDKAGKENRLLKMADNLRFLALKELEGMKDKNTEPICSLMDGFSAFLRVQKFHFPQKV